MSKFVNLNILFIALALGSNVAAAAEEYSCIGKIDHITQNYLGAIHVISNEIYGDSDPRKICSLTEVVNGVYIDVCKGWLSKLLAVNAASRKISFQYRDSMSCTTQPAFSASLLVYSIQEDS
jgi:hypothetical protein